MNHAQQMIKGNYEPGFKLIMKLYLPRSFRSSIFMATFKRSVATH